MFSLFFIKFIFDDKCSGIGITIIPALKALGISVDMPETFKNETKGLLGNYNGVDSDDFILPNGTVLPSNMTDKQKFEDFGSHCKLLLYLIVCLSSFFLFNNNDDDEALYCAFLRCTVD